MSADTMVDVRERLQRFANAHKLIFQDHGDAHRPNHAQGFRA